ncbi:MAG: WbqC family protein [candidate division KSB1 bacterium]|nr:WbqC family protein [candidate division KSB1 bacterium]
MVVTAEYPYVFPPVWFFLKAWCADVVLLADVYKLPKRPRINRYAIAGKDGRRGLTVPVHRPEGWRSSIDRVRIVSDASWKRSHLRSLANTYAMAPYLDYYREEMESLFRYEGDSFVEFAERTILWLASKLGRPGVRWLRLSAFCTSGGGESCLREACRRLGARGYVQLRDEPDVKNEESFVSQGLRIYQAKLPEFSYRNLAGEGDFSLSALDLLLNWGPEAVCQLRQLSQRMASEASIPVTQQAAQPMGG